MVKATKRSTIEGSNDFPTPFTLESFRDDIANVYAHEMRNVAWMTDARTAWRIPSIEEENPYCIFDTGLNAAELGLEYRFIQDSALAVHLEHLYNYAFHGVLDRNKESMQDESIYTWLSALVYDIANGAMNQEYELYGDTSYESANRCLLVMETANARVTLEGGEPFYSRFQGGKEGYLESDYLSIRQMALLAGMEEMSIRAAANPKRANALKTVTTENGTRIETTVAKEWLQTKGRYVLISHQWTAGQIDLTKRRFSTLNELDSALYSRVKMFSNSSNPAIESQLEKCGVESIIGISDLFVNHNPNDQEKVDRLTAIGTLLDLPAQLLFLRAKEAEANERLAAIEWELRNATQQQ